MFLADAVAGYVASLTERELDAPLIALLRSRGFTKVHLVHGQYEFGKDIIARRLEDGIETQYCLQSKAGDLNARSWRELRLQVDAMRTGTVAHPGFEPVLPRRLVVVTNGRLIGGAAIEFQDYNTHHRSRDELIADLWDIDELAPMFYDVLVDGVTARHRSRTLELLGQLGSGRGTYSLIREYAAAWFDPDLTRRDSWANVLTAAMLAQEASTAGREDLAAQLAYHLIRCTWEVPTVEDAEAHRRVARALLRQVAHRSWDQVRNLAADDVVAQTLRGSPGFAAFATHPVKIARLCEILSMGGLLSLDESRAVRTDDNFSAEFDTPAVAAWLKALVETTPGLSHPVSDDYAFSLLVTCVFLHASGQEVEHLLREAAIWLLDRVEYADGIAEAGVTPNEMVRVLLGSPYRGLRKGGRKDSYGLTVILDLARVFGLADLFADVVHDLDAVEAYASIVRGYPPSRAILIARLSYADHPTEVENLVAAHYEDSVDSMPAAANRAWFDVAATWATLRDRHTPAILDALVHAL
jgi:hypothetical protein